MPQIVPCGEGRHTSNIVGSWHEPSCCTPGCYNQWVGEYWLTQCFYEVGVCTNVASHIIFNMINVSSLEPRAALTIMFWCIVGNGIHFAGSCGSWTFNTDCAVYRRNVCLYKGNYCCIQHSTYLSGFICYHLKQAVQLRSIFFIFSTS